MKRPVPLGFVGHTFKPGQSGNPGGRTASFAECQRVAREASPKAISRLIELMHSDDERVALMAADKVLERAWGRPKEQEPGKRFSDLPPEEREREAGRLITEARALLQHARAEHAADEARIIIEGEAEPLDG